MRPDSDATEAGLLFAEYHDRIRRYIAGMVREPAEAEDLTQETFLRAHCQQQTLRDPAAARAWLYRIATNVCVDRLRQRRPQVALEEPEVEGQAAAVEPAAAHRMLERAETSACVQRCLDHLSDSYRAVLLMYEARGLTVAEIAELLDVSVGSVKIRLHRARLRLLAVMNYGCHVSEAPGGVPCCEPKK
jgi:RNA polymerase sigma-70 factor (ECF subfamily)